MTATLNLRDGIAVLTLGDHENRFSPEWLDTVGAQLDQVEADARGLVTVGTGKFYSNGLDLDWLMANGERADWYVGRVHDLFARILTFPLPTVAAVNGHAFGAGAMFALAHDFRTMRADRGYYCFPEVDIDIPFTPGMAALIQAKLSPQDAVVAMTTGHRYGGAEALTARLVDATAPDDEVVDAAIERITPIAGKDRGTLGAIKTTMFAPVVAALRTS
ncbi:enoyl-CoA hydratase/isomerase family protein [Rhodococcus sp. BP-349]|uniref:enoyl-CoA hydratase/isomerase family protein n=1 Tax=unclassified Rhodococcus (in: high G+C Gram-positive bacteria) TaxID=192944 RepID=UPI001C9B79C3|nr:MULTISPECIES: enoyl-CoA hydratase/isomerase family protein [unclassified Rhodococcus (in: high G+C Gram-positive bacteria)]MBY6540401.1 enoyl-CoA hydratase/isomerase family protein [Rhodococcus sp. BP-363]MBY6545574.1 enoyl-CoA hydratase/isomerase family protein [Rhodococcus sp. BP-369]MBY6564804.1 enoyl-CoA hydratase/isomerase family protein [Rhodococcus sp. BP-370]MBY6578260.1 enoyl-CoA hydratase/isomerase family protein [Rhodococcus sp. BP-364]MBY6587561.1 enoyl-CoA hydratase/isomerase f